MTAQIADVVERRSDHTPGPWACTTRQGSWDWVVYSASDPNIEVCQMFHDGTHFNEVGEANARLIAAAPDLLAALELALCELSASANQLTYLGRNVSPDGSVSRAIEAARSALRAAQGETTP